MKGRKALFLAVVISLVLLLSTSCGGGRTQRTGSMVSELSVESIGSASEQGSITTSTEQPDASRAGAEEQGDLSPRHANSPAPLIPGSQDGGGFSLTLDSPSRTADPLTFSLVPGAPFKGQLIFGNDTKSEMEFLLLCLLDYVQTPCVKGQAEAIYRFGLKAGGQEVLDVHLSQLTPGLHDLVVVVFYAPDAHSTAPRFREESRFLYTFHRVNLIVGDTHRKPGVEYRFFKEPGKFAARGMYALTLTRQRVQDPWDTPWHLAEVSAGASIPFHLWWNNPQAARARFAVVGLLDYWQVPVWDGSPVIYGELADHRRTDIVGHLTAPTSPGSHEFVILVIENPYTELAQQASADQPIPAFVYSSDRVLITVR